MVVVGEADLRGVLKAYASYYNRVSTHLSLSKAAPLFRLPSQTVGERQSPSLADSIIYMFAYRVFGKDSIRYG